MIRVSVTENHIKAAKATPRSSPIALALIEMGFTDVSVTLHYAFIGEELYMLPEQAIASEKAFDFLVKNGANQDEILGNIFPYQFELQDTKLATNSSQEGLLHG